MTTVFLFAALFVLLFLGMPIAMALGLSSLLTILLFAPDSMASLALKFFQTMEQFVLLAIPFFILAGNFLTTGGVARRMINFAVSAVGHLPGGLAIASVLACMLFAAVSGSSPATVVAIGSIVIAGMVRVGYTQEFATGVIVNAGTLGILIPPSIVMVVYAAATETSVGRLFMAGVIPGILLGTALMVAIYIAAVMIKLPRQPRAPWRDRFFLFRDAMWGLLLIVIVMGGIYGGVFTPTEAAAVAAVYAFVCAVFIYGDLKWLGRGLGYGSQARVCAACGSRPPLYQGSEIHVAVAQGEPHARRQEGVEDTAGGQQAAQHRLRPQGELRPVVELRARGLGTALLRELAGEPQVAAAHTLREVRRDDRPSLGRHCGLLPA